MKKNWLIRTRNNHLLGPISLNKVKELIENKSLKGDDEICSGNGYWFFIREKDLIQKYIYEEVPQGFNPVSEASTVLVSNQVQDAISIDVKNDITVVDFNLDLLKDDQELLETNSVHDTNKQAIEDDTLDNLEKAQIKKDFSLDENIQIELKSEDITSKGWSLINSKILFILLLLFVIAIVYGFMNRKIVLEKIMAIV
ncbi:MAG: hypothetical protein N4A33_05245 [Bacteriovoracaceae bacterium]|jgi:hypothetical protein|nr:hypothetical protein [Bacteriovoracaceae bacterium]